MAKSRNGFVDILRIVFAFLVVEFHFWGSGEGAYHLGKLGVEFFVILSGFFFFSSYSRQIGNATTLGDRLNYWKNYMKKRYFRFFWYALVAFILVFIVKRVWWEGISSVGEFADKMSGDIWEILLVKMSGLNREKGLLNGPAWTLSSMLIAEFFILGMLIWAKRFFLSLFMPLSLLGGVGFWINMESADKDIFLGLFTFGTLRVYLLTCCGIIAYFLSQQLSNTHFSNFGKGCLNIFELVSYAGVIYIAYSRGTRNWQFVSILFLTMAIAISFSGWSYAQTAIKSNKLTNFLGELSLSLYLTHEIWLYTYKQWYPDEIVRWTHEREFILAVFAVGIIYTLAMRGFMRVLPYMQKLVHDAFITKEQSA